MIDAATRQRIVLVAESLEGLPYIIGANGPPDGGADCSGGVCWCLRVAGVAPFAADFPHHRDWDCDGLWHDLAPIDEDEHALPGDLAFYGRATDLVHVVVVGDISGVGLGGRHHVWSASGGGRDVTSAEIARQRRARWRRWESHMYRPDFVGFRRPWLREG